MALIMLQKFTMPLKLYTGGRVFKEQPVQPEEYCHADIGTYSHQVAHPAATGVEDGLLAP